MPRLEVDPGRVPRTLEAYLTATNLDALAAEGLAPHEERALAQLSAAAAAAAPPVQTGAQLYSALHTARVLTTGCDSIDDALLHTGLRTGQVVEVCGESASGKTQLCMAAAVQAARAGLRVVYVDTSNALRGRRLEEMEAAQRQAHGDPQAADPLKFIEVRRCYDAHSLLRTLDELVAQQAQQAQQQQAQQQQAQQQAQQAQQQAGGGQGVQQPPAPGPQQGGEGGAPSGAAPSAAAVRRRLQDLPIQLLVVDSLSAVITPILGGGAGQHSQGHALLVSAALALKSLAAACNAAVLVTNHLVGGSDRQRHEKRPAMGESWRNQPHARVQLWRPPHGGAPDAVRCTATLRASTLQAAGATAAYYLCPAGLSAQPPPAAAEPDNMQM